MACDYQGAKQSEDEGNEQKVGVIVVIGFPNGRSLVFHKNSKNQTHEFTEMYRQTGKMHSQMVSTGQRCHRFMDTVVTYAL